MSDQATQDAREWQREQDAAEDQEQAPDGPLPRKVNQLFGKAHRRHGCPYCERDAIQTKHERALEALRKCAGQLAYLQAAVRNQLGDEKLREHQVVYLEARAILAEDKQ